MGDFAIVNATLVRPDRDRVSVRCERGDVVVRAGRVESLGTASGGLVRVDAEGRLVTPGLVDPHTHATFLGDRSAEFCARAAGASYLELAQRGGGIVATVGPTRCGSRDARVERLRARLARLAQNGVTTVEVKSGYGLDEATELALLEELAGVDDPLLPRVLPTLMAAHALPPEFGAHPSQAQRAQWVDAIVHRLIPETARRRLAARVDVFVEQAAFTQAEAERIAAAARTHGLALHLHVDQLTAGAGAQFAARVGAQAVAHLERTDESGVVALAASGAVAILLPTSTLAAREPGFAPARALVEAGVPVALSTNLNPGTGPTESTSLMLFLASIGLRLTPEESLWAATRGAARALGIDAGLLEPGADADLVLWNARDPSHLAYHAAVNHVRTVWRAGRVVAERPQAALDCDGVL